ncbi:MAG: carboxypeptidase-like regulatory domain-containing protein, partial [Candidatus Latescibacterota bacterium]
MRNILFFVMVVFLAGSAWAQNEGTVEGVVRESNGEPLAGANVLITSPSLNIRRGMTADGEGYYKVSALPAGVYDITVSFVGYKAQTKIGVKISTGIVSKANFSLEAEAFMQGQIVV